MICQACAPLHLRWFDLKSLLTHRSLCLLGVTCPQWCSFDHHAVWIHWAPSSGSGGSSHSVLQTKEKGAKKKSGEHYHGRSELHTVIGFPILIKAIQTPLIFIDVSMQSPVPPQPQATEPLLISRGSGGFLLTLLSRN